MIDTIKNFKSKIVPLMFGILITVSFMYIYDENLTLIFLLCSIIIQGLVYVFYDYVSKKGKILQYISIIGSMVAMILLLIIIGSLYNSNNILDFMIWFLSPQGVVEYSLQYIFVMLVGLNFFIASTIYYFTQVRYRMLTTFLLFLVPFAMFAKEDKDIPAIFLLTLIIMYFATLIVCGQNNIYEIKNLKIIENKSYVKSIGTFILTFLVLISAIPKPDIVANRDVFENLISANNLTNYLLAQLGNFTDTSNGAGLSFLSSNKKLFSVECSETVGLKARTFSNYNFEKNVWLRADGIKSLIDNSTMDTNLYYNDTEVNLINYDRYGYPLTNNTTNDFQQTLNPAKFLNAIVFACNKDKDFANTYNLSDIDTNYNFSNSTKNITIEAKDFPTSFMLNPTNTYNIASFNSTLEMCSTYSGVICINNEQASLPDNAKYSLDYYSSEIISNSNAKDILYKLNFETYDDFLNDLYSIVKDTQFNDVTYAYIQDYNNTITYSSIFTDCNSEKILQLAKDITKDCNSDIEKALALQNYFISNNYNYNADYQAEDGATIETFLFESKTGACYEYSTSMILMARALGLPARYIEGFLVDNHTGTTKTIDITAGSSHAYPEVYISGYGWCYFEPTQTLFSNEQDDTTIKLSENYQLFMVSLGILLVIVLISIFVVVVYPKIEEKNFRSRVLKKSVKEALLMIVYRIRKISKLPNTQTLEETQQSILRTYNVDINEIIVLANKMFYGKSSYDKTTELEVIKKSLDRYIYLYTFIMELNKEDKKSKKKKV